MAKEWAKPFYNSALWKDNIRPEILMKAKYICQNPGCYNIATEVHHKIELTPDNINDPNIAVNANNLMALCSDCHKAITKAQHNKSKAACILPEVIFNDNGYPVIVPPRG